MDRHPDSDSKVIFPDKWHGRPPSPNFPAVQNSEEVTVQFIEKDKTDSQLPTLAVRPSLVPERSDFLEGDAPAADKVRAFLTRALEASDGSATVAGALVPWICDALLSNRRARRDRRRPARAAVSQSDGLAAHG
jgi:hypothetical protein